MASVYNRLLSLFKRVSGNYRFVFLIKIGWKILRNSIKTLNAIALSKKCWLVNYETFTLTALI